MSTEPPIEFGNPYQVHESSLSGFLRRDKFLFESEQASFAMVLGEYADRFTLQSEAVPKSVYPPTDEEKRSFLSWYISTLGARLDARPLYLVDSAGFLDSKPTSEYVE